MMGRIIRVEDDGGVLVDVTVRCGDRDRLVPLGRTEFESLLAAYGGLECVMGAEVEVCGAGSATSLQLIGAG